LSCEVRKISTDGAGGSGFLDLVLLLGDCLPETQCHVPEDSNPSRHCCGNLRWHCIILLSL